MNSLLEDICFLKHGDLINAGRQGVVMFKFGTNFWRRQQRVYFFNMPAKDVYKSLNIHNI